MRLIECVPNFSEGHNTAIIDIVAAAVPPELLLDRTSDPDHNRSVLTFAGSPAKVVSAALEAVRAAVDRIDISCHTGVHPRLGAADVVPLVPLEDVSLEDCAAMARELGECIWDELGVPVFLYEAAARRPECQRLESVRKLGHSGLAPDIGTGRHPTAGACVVGARKFLIAWNINLRSQDLDSAREIAKTIRASNGGLPAVKALGLPLESRGQVQVSINLVDFEVTPLHVVYAAVEELAHARGIEIAGSELIGLIPQAALIACAGHDLHWENLQPDSVLERRLKKIV
ncbi:MAG TPA: glutamate formimidoyltransferase [Bryobacteraceae bacterium]|nr:glutamate formimidoyltransferase [Bryobacteraceae bacterium]